MLTDQWQSVEMLVLSNVVGKGRGIPEQSLKVARRKSEKTEGKVKQSESRQRERKLQHMC